jgi:hemoglobin
LTSLYEKLGEETSISAVVGDFYERVLADETLAPFFEGVDMSSLRRHQASFLSAATGGPKAYTGPDLAEAHANRGIGDGNFDRVVEHLIGALSKAGVAETTIDETVAALSPLRGVIVDAG